MIFLPRFPLRPPHGRVDGVIYWGSISTVANKALYFVDYDTGAVGFILITDLPGGPPSGAAGGDLGGTYPNPTVDNVPDAALSANIPKMTAGVLPAVSGALLTNIPAPARLGGGTVTLDSAGEFTLALSPLTGGVVACWQGSMGSGFLYTYDMGGGAWKIISDAGAVSSGESVCWVAY